MEGREHMIRNEINILKKISQGNRNILSLVDYFETMNNCNKYTHTSSCSLISFLVYLVTDLASGGELFDRICEKGSYFEKDAAHVIRTVCAAVAYLHDNGIVHRGKFVFLYLFFFFPSFYVFLLYSFFSFL